MIQYSILSIVEHWKKGHEGELAVRLGSQALNDRTPERPDEGVIQCWI